MKRKIVLLAVLVLMISLLSGCCLKHEWQDATCEDPQTCAKCEKTEGEALGHEWEDATCEDPKTCSVCGDTKGKAKGHEWEDATCTEAKFCTVCEKTEGEPTGHAVNVTSAVTADGDKFYLEGTCTFCGEEAKVEIEDMDAFMQDIACGSWEGAQMTDFEYDYDLPAGTLMVEMAEDGGMECTLEGELFTGEWYVTEVVENEGYMVAYIALDCGSDGILSGFFMGQDTSILCLVTDSYLFYCFQE